MTKEARIYNGAKTASSINGAGKRGEFSEYLDSGSNNLNECYHKLKDESEKQQLFKMSTDDKEKV